MFCFVVVFIYVWFFFVVVWCVLVIVCVVFLGLLVSVCRYV